MERNIANASPQEVDQLPQPTKEMTDFFKRRTDAHIACVERHMVIMDGYTGLTLDTLKTCACKHDATKFSDPERMGYVWLTWARHIPKFKYPSNIEPIVAAATHHHLHNVLNRHHPESHAAHNDMTDLDIVEAVCDMTAISRELNNSSCQGWVNANQDRFKFTGARATFFRDTITELDRRLMVAGLEQSESTFFYKETGSSAGK